MNATARAWWPALLLLAGCVIKEDSDLCEPIYEEGACTLRYSPYRGYYRSCDREKVDEICPWDTRPPVDTPPVEGPSAGEPPAEPADAGATVSEEPAPPEPPAEEEPPAAEPEEPAGPQTRPTPFEIACERDNQCGSGVCTEGLCFYGCDSDAQCGSGDRCSVESGQRVCNPDPNPAVQCTRTLECGQGSVCLNASCRQTCERTSDCANLLDRCLDGICEPDRRPLGECVLNSECGPGAVCLDGACVARCVEGSCEADAAAPEPAEEVSEGAPEAG